MTIRSLKKISDDVLILNYQRDNNKKWMGELYQRYAHLVYGVCLKYLKNKSKAQDALSGIFEELVEKLTSQDIHNFSSWLYTYAKNYCLMEIRKGKSKKHGIEMGTHLSANDVVLVSDNSKKEEKELQELTYNALEKAIENLTSPQRECIVKFYLNQKNYSQIAQELNLTLNQVKSAIQNGKRNLKIALIKKQ